MCELPNTITVEPVGIYSPADTDCILDDRCPGPSKIALPKVAPPACRMEMECQCASCGAGGEQGAIHIPSPRGGAGGCGCAPACDAGLNVNNGNLSVHLGTPGAGALAPADVLSYHSRAASGSALGYGVQNAFGAKVVSTGSGCDAHLIRCDGSRYCFACKDPTTGEYRYIPPGAPSVLKKTAVGWEESLRE
jgi:hypothetical protein